MYIIEIVLIILKVVAGIYSLYRCLLVVAELYLYFDDKKYHRTTYFPLLYIAWWLISLFILMERCENGKTNPYKNSGFKVIEVA